MKGKVFTREIARYKGGIKIGLRETVWRQHCEY